MLTKLSYKALLFFDLQTAMEGMVGEGVRAGGAARRGPVKRSSQASQVPASQVLDGCVLFWRAIGSLSNCDVAISKRTQRPLLKSKQAVRRLLVSPCLLRSLLSY